MSTPDAPGRVAPVARALMWLGLVTVAGAAAVLSFAVLRHLALMCRFTRRLAWLLPVVVDARATVASLVWLGRWGLLGGSVAGNALGHGLTAYGAHLHWLVVVAVSAVAPAVLGAVVHLAVLATHAPVAVDPRSGLGSDLADRGPDHAGPEVGRRWAGRGPCRTTERTRTDQRRTGWTRESRICLLRWRRSVGSGPGGPARWTSPDHWRTRRGSRCRRPGGPDPPPSTPTRCPVARALVTPLRSRTKTSSPCFGSGSPKRGPRRRVSGSGPATASAAGGQTGSGLPRPPGRLLRLGAR